MACSFLIPNEPISVVVYVTYSLRWLMELPWPRVAHQLLQWKDWGNLEWKAL